MLHVEQQCACMKQKNDKHRLTQHVEQSLSQSVVWKTEKTVCHSLRIPNKLKRNGRPTLINGERDTQLNGNVYVHENAHVYAYMFECKCFIYFQSLKQF